jgi:hypothetical protein
MHGKIESKLSNMDNKYPIIFRTEALEVKTKENTSFILTHNKRNDKSTISVSEGKVKVFSAVKRKECVILSKDQYLEIVAGQELKYVTLPTGVSIIPNCNIDYEDDYLMENLTDDNTGSGENSNNSSGENNTNTDGNNTNGTNTGESGTEGNISDIQMDFVSFSDDGVDLSQSNNNNDTTDENDDDDDDDDNDD